MMKVNQTAVLGLCGLALSLLAAPGPPRKEQMLRGWADRVKVGVGEEQRSVEVVFDYDNGETRRRVFDDRNKLLSEELLAAQPRPTVEEIDAAFDIVLSDDELGDLASSLNAQLDGGFLLREAPGEPCGPPARCLQVFMLSETRDSLHQRPVVDLTRRGRIAYRDYSPEDVE